MDEQANKSNTLLTLRLLETLVSRSEDWGVSEIAAALGITKGRAHRHLAQLREAGYVAQSHGNRRYSPGWRLMLLGQSAVSHADIIAIARPVMEELRAQVQQTVVLSQLTEQAVTPIVVVAGGSPIDVVLLPGTRFAYNSSAQGKVALAFANAAQKSRWSRYTTEKRTERTILDQEQLWAEVGAVRRAGWAAAPGETFDGINTIAAPVFAHDGDLRATLAIVAALHYLGPTPPPEYVEALTRAAQSISHLLGYEEGGPASASASDATVTDPD